MFVSIPKLAAQDPIPSSWKQGEYTLDDVNIVYIQPSDCWEFDGEVSITQDMVDNPLPLSALDD